MSVHTPGPWIVVDDGYSPVVRKQFRVDHHMNICGAVHGYMYAEDEKANQMANARMIAAAPDLLVALQDALFLIEQECADGAHTTEAINARAAIAKATGSVE